MRCALADQGAAPGGAPARHRPDSAARSSGYKAKALLRSPLCGEAAQRGSGREMTTHSKPDCTASLRYLRRSKIGLE